MKLQNDYYLMRHGLSYANEAGIIISSPKEGIGKWGLCEEGKEQARIGAKTWAPTNSKELIIYHSDFLRTTETAFVVAKELCVEKMTASPLLRERFFGDYEGLDNSHYSKVWALDQGNDHNENMGVESPAHVAGRFLSLIQDIEVRYEGRTILLVSHGDILQIGQTVFEGIAPKKHRSLDHLAVADIRKMVKSSINIEQNEDLGRVYPKQV